MIPASPGRISQNLPTPKCSTCHQFVPLEELGDHICALTSPVPRPTISSTAAAALLPKRLQGRTPSPGPVPSASRSASPVRRASPNPSQSRGPPLSKPGSISPTKVTFQLRPSPLAVGSNAGPSTDLPLSVNTSSPMRTHLPQANDLRVPTRAPSNNTPTTRTRAPSNASVNQPTPTTAHPTMQDTPYPPFPGVPSRNALPIIAAANLGPQVPPLNAQGTPPIRNVPASNRGPSPSGYRGGPPIPRTGNLVMPPRSMGSPAPQKIVNFSGTINPGDVVNSPQQSFVPPPERGIDTKTGGEAGMAGVGRRGFAAAARAAMFAAPPKRPLGPQPPIKPNTLNYLDLDAASRANETPPLSAGSGYSSHSPGPTSPLPQSELLSQPVAARVTRTPSPPDRFVSTPTQSVPLKPVASDPVASLTSPLSARFPFFEKFRNKIPANTSTSDSTNTTIDDASSTSVPISVVRKNTSDSSFSGMLYRSVTSSTTSSRHVKDVRRPISPLDSESEYGGLAYADSTDYEDNDGELSRSQSHNNGARLHMPSLVLRTGSSSSSRRYRYPSESEHSENNNDRTGILIGSTRPRPGHSRNTSASSVSSAGGGGGPLTRDRANPSAIAQALGLSQTPPSDYGKMGGPGVMGGRLGRSDSSSSRRNAGRDSMEEMEKALEEAKIKTRGKQPSFGSSSQRSNLYRNDTTSSVTSSRKDDNGIGSSGVGVKAHRSNTIQNPHPNSPEGKPIKLPMRALTSPKLERDKALDGTSVKKERVRKAKVCLKCQKVVDNGRWVSVDGGGVLCEKCWKNMYLPKCRRCNLSIEKQAVSSSDGQLKGKYHKECFNCDTCHKPFPDRTFYVYDGKPLCAYHYHEANDSLCAAARCGHPIEGPCAVSHSGDRYHPEHMTCEYPGYPPCKQMLSEYWEIDGRMLCERHAHSASVFGSDEEEDEWAKSTRAKKRVTRFIDLAGGGVGDFGGDADVTDISELR